MKLFVAIETCSADPRPSSQEMVSRLVMRMARLQGELQPRSRRRAILPSELEPDPRGFERLEELLREAEVRATARATMTDAKGPAESWGACPAAVAEADPRPAPVDRDQYPTPPPVMAPVSLARNAAFGPTDSDDSWDDPPVQPSAPWGNSIDPYRQMAPGEGFMGVG